MGTWEQFRIEVATAHRRGREPAGRLPQACPLSAGRRGRLPCINPPRLNPRCHAELQYQPCRQGIQRFPDAVARGVPRARRSGASGI
jgi:hypothetical protein